MSGVHEPRRANRSIGWLTRSGVSPPLYVWVTPGAEPPDSVEPGEWIEGKLTRLRGATHVGAIVPKGFGAYARVFHPAQGDGSDVERVRWSEVAERAGRVMHAEAQWEAISRPLHDAAPPGARVHEPRTGYCPPEVRGLLIEILKQHTVDRERCWAAIWHGWAGIGGVYPEIPLLRLPQREYYLFSVTYDVLGDQIFGGPVGEGIGPNLWWSTDRSWFVATEIDFRWTYVGGSATCIAEILSDDRLEVLPTELSHRGDYLSDTINGPVRP